MFLFHWRGVHPSSYNYSFIGSGTLRRYKLKPIINPRSEKKANIGTGNTNACKSKKPTPVAKDIRIDTINLLVFFKRIALIIPKKIVMLKKITFRIR